MTKPSLEQKMVAVLRAARKKLEPCLEHGVGLSRESATELDRLLEGGESELLSHLQKTKQVFPSDRITVRP